MGLIKAAAAAFSGTMDDIWKELFVCDALPMDVLMVRGYKRISNRSANTGGDPNTITHGSTILVADGQCAVVVSGGKVIDSCDQPGEYTFQDPDHTSVLGGIFKETGRRFAYGGDAPPKMQRVCYINIKECMNNPFSTTAPITLKAGAGMDPLYETVSVSGAYSYRIADPALFYKLIAGNISGSYTRDRLNGQITAELLKALGPAIDALCKDGIRPSDIPVHTEELCRVLQEAASKGWIGRHGLQILSVAVSSLTPGDMGGARGVQELQSTAARFGFVTAAGPAVVPAPAAAGKPVSKAGSRAQTPAGTWTCVCGTASTGKFCPECGRSRKWTCACGQENLGKFCINCGKRRPSSGC